MTLVERVVATGLSFPEGPSMGSDGSILVVELAGRRVTRVQPDGAKETFATIEGAPNGSAFGADGALYICNNGGRWAAETSTGGKWGPGGYPASIQRIWPDSTIETVVSAIDGVALNSPNDICFGPDGGFWFTDPIWPDERGVCAPGDLAYAQPSGEAMRIHTELEMPNGLGVTDDGSTLLVTASRTFTIHAFPILGPGRLGQATPIRNARSRCVSRWHLFRRGRACSLCRSRRQPDLCLFACRANSRRRSLWMTKTSAICVSVAPTTERCT